MSEAAERLPLNSGDENQAPARAPEAIAAEPDARKQGWVPIERYRGDPTEWVDADEFVKRGREINPILRANNERLEENLRKAQADNAALKAEQENQGKQLKELLEVNEEVAAEARKTLRATLVSDLAAAHKDGDSTKIAEATAALTEHVAEPAKPVVVVPPVVKTAGPDPEAVRAFNNDLAGDHPWWNEDTPIATGMRATAGQLIRQMQTDGRITTSMTRVEAAKLALAETERMYDVKRPAPSKVGSGRPSGGGTGGASKAFADLPSDAKSAAERSLKRMQAGGSIGKGKTFADDAAYRAHYVKQFAANGGFDS